MRLELNWRDGHLKRRASALLLTNYHFCRARALITLDVPRDGDYKSISTQTDVVPPCKHGHFAVRTETKNFEWLQQQHKGGTDFRQRVRGSTVHANRSVNQSAAEPKHTQPTEQNRKLTDRRKCLIRLFLDWRGSRSHCNNILTIAIADWPVILSPNQFATSLKNKAKCI